MTKIYEIPAKDKLLFDKMRTEAISERERLFFASLEMKELYDMYGEQDDLLWNAERPNAYSIYRVYRHWYMVSVPKNNESDCDEFEYSCLADMLNDDFTKHVGHEQLDIKGKTNLEILREMNYESVNLEFILG